MIDEYRIVLADDHALLRSGLTLLLNGQENYTVVGEASTGLAAIALTEDIKPDLLLLDLSMPGLGGLDAIEVILQKSEHTKILILTMHDDPEYLKKALKAGASGYILKKAADVELLSAIKAVMQGEVYIHSSLTKSLLEEILPESKENFEQDSWKNLSAREKEVLKLVAFGHTSQEIAEKINLSTKTIDTYRFRGMEKLGIKTRAALVRIAIDQGLLDR